MGKRLKTAFAHKVVVSPIGALMENRFYERIKTNAVPNEFRLSRAAAAARATVGGTVDDFLHELGGPTDVPEAMREQIATGLAQFADDWRARQDAVRSWREAFWGSADKSNDELVDLENERRAKSEKCMMPSNTLGFLFKEKWVPSVKFDIPEPHEALDRWADRIADPTSLYGAPDAIPVIEESQRVLGPAGVEYIVRFPSPSPMMKDTVYARVFEPEECSGSLPTLIYGGGLALAYDQIRYWPAEDYIGRPLAAEGCRVILVESPWHGRRMPRGYFSGEPYLAHAPVSLFQLYSAQAQETAILVDWVRSLGSPTVAVGGISLGAIAAQQVAGHCAIWPEGMRPDFVVLIATAKHIDRVIMKGKMSRLTGLDQAVQGTGWTDVELEKLDVLLDPPPEPGIASDHIVAILGEHDTYVPYRWGLELLEDWNVPEGNLVSWDAGHFGVLLGMFRKSIGRELIVQTLKQGDAK